MGGAGSGRVNRITPETLFKHILDRYIYYVDWIESELREYDRKFPIVKDNVIAILHLVEELKTAYLYKKFLTVMMTIDRGRYSLDEFYKTFIGIKNNRINMLLNGDAHISLVEALRINNFVKNYHKDNNFLKDKNLVTELEEEEFETKNFVLCN